MSFRIEKKLFVKKENYFDFKKYLSEKGILQLYQPRKINSVYLIMNNLECIMIQLRDYCQEKDQN